MKNHNRVIALDLLVTIIAALLMVAFFAVRPSPAAVDRQCNYTVGSTTTAQGFANCTEEIADLSTKAFAIATSASNTGNAISIVTSPAVTTLTNGQVAIFNSPLTISGAATFQLDGTAAASLYQADGTTALISGDLVSGVRYMVSYRSDTGRWLLMGSPGVGAAPSSIAYLTVGNSASLTAERAIATDGTTITGSDGGANGSYTLSVTTNGIGNSQIRQGAATSIIGRSANSTGNVADIAASADGQYLRRSSSALSFGVPTATEITNTPAGNIAATTVQAALNELDTEKQPLDATLTSLAAFNTNGLIAQTAADTFAGRTLTGPAAGITVTNGNGVSGNPTLALANDLAGVEGLASNGIAARTATDTWAVRTLTGTANEVTVSNGDGVSGNPTFSLPSALTFTGKTITGGTFSGPSITTPGAGITFAGSTSGTTVLQATAIAGTTTLTLPAATDTLVGKATTDTLTNKTFDTAGTGNSFSIAGVAVTANTGTGAVVRATSPTLVTPALGTPSSATLTNATGLPVSTGISGLGTGVATFLATPSSANLAAAVTGETGSGALVFDTSPTLTTPNLGTPSAVNLTNGTALPISGISGLGTGVGTALAVARNSNGGMTLQSGSPTSGNCVRWAVGGGIEDSGGTCGGGGGGGSPGGSSGDLQYNNAGAFDGVTLGGGLNMNSGTLSLSREVLSANRTYYVRTDGSDSNDGLANSSGGAFLTIQKALDVAAGLDRSTHTVTIQVGTGTYTGALTWTGGVGSVPVVLQGDTGTPSNVVISVTSANALEVTAARLTLQGFKMQTTTSGSCLRVTQGGSVTIGSMEFGACVAAQLYAQTGGYIGATGSYTVSGGGQYHMLAQIGGIIETYNLTVTASGTPGWSVAAIESKSNAIVSMFNTTFSGSSTGTRYSIYSGGSLSTFGAALSSLPGDSPGRWDDKGLIIKQTSDYTLTSTTAAQKIFNASTNGRLGLGTGAYTFECGLYLTTMSGTSGNAQFQILGGGGATLGSVLYLVDGIDNTTPLNAGTRTGSASVTSSGAASIVTATTGTGMVARIHGTFNVTAAGTIIPSLALVTANAAVVKAGSYCKFLRNGDTGTNIGEWD